MKYRMKKLKKTNPNFLRATNNLQNIKSESVVRKIRSQVLNILREHTDGTIDVLLLQEKYPEFIQHVCNPLNVKMFSQQQLHIGNNSVDSILYFDATGSVVRSKKCTKRIYYYCGIVRVKESHRLCPIIEMIACEHDHNTIYDFFIRFKKICKIEKIHYTFNVFVTDFSLANMYAASLAFNDMAFEQYLEYCFEVAEGKKITKTIVVLMLCCAHLMKNVCEHINKQMGGLATQVKFFLKESVACVFYLNTLEEATIWFTLLVEILCRKKNNEILQKFLIDLQSLCKQLLTERDYTFLSSDIPKQSSSDPHELLIDDDKCNNLFKMKHLRKNNRFYKYFNSLFIHARSRFAEEETCTSITNPYHCPEFVTFLLDKYIPFLPMWSRLMLRFRTNPHIRVSKNPVERFFGILKYDILEGSRDLPPSIFIRKTREYVNMIYQDIKLDLTKGPLATAPRLKYDVFQSNLNIPSDDDRVSISSVETSR